MRMSLRSLLTLSVAVWLLAALPRSGWSSNADARVDINTASVAELAALPGIGESKAKAIVEYRAAEPFKTVDDLKKVKGIGDKMMESLRPSITAGAGGAPKQNP